MTAGSSESGPSVRRAWRSLSFTPMVDGSPVATVAIASPTAAADPDPGAAADAALGRVAAAVVPVLVPPDLRRC